MNNFFKVLFNFMLCIKLLEFIVVFCRDMLFIFICFFSSGSNCIFICRWCILSNVLLCGEVVFILVIIRFNGKDKEICFMEIFILVVFEVYIVVLFIRKF